MRYVRKYNVHPWCDNAPSFSYQRCSVSILTQQRFNVDTPEFVCQRYSVCVFHGAEFVCKNVGDGGDKQKYCPRFQCCQ